jgi:hypothetical protein
MKKEEKNVSAILNEETPLLTPSSSHNTSSFCCSENEGCCKNNAIKDKITTVDINNGQEDLTCQLSSQPWKYKSVALLCALFLASKN